MSNTNKLEIAAILLSLVATGFSGWAVYATNQATLMQRRLELRSIQLSSIDASLRASNRAMCFLRMSGKNTIELDRLHRLLENRNRHIAETLTKLQTMEYPALTSAEEFANSTLTAVAAIERQVLLTKISMSKEQLEHAQLACPSES